MKYPDSHEEAEILKAEAKRASRSKPIEKMHELYGSHFPDHCGDCKHLLTREFSNTYFKCRIYGVSGGPATDWRKFWDACSKFEAR